MTQFLLNTLVPVATGLLGTLLGWSLRSFQFGADQECANPEHSEEEIPELRAEQWKQEADELAKELIAKSGKLINETARANRAEDERNEYHAKWQKALRDIDEMNRLQIDPDEEE